ncbi:MAG: hypothetical protein GWN59_04050 [Calditrichae bacterium]|nr:hypothetical protein [Calditrichia bacterium]
MIVANPLWGIGPGLFDQVFEIYKVPGFYDAFGHSHNDFLNMAVNSGILGLLAWLGVWGSWFYFVLKAFRQNQLFKFESRLMLGCILSISGILVAALFQCYFTDLENNIAWWFIAALGLHAAIQENKQVNVTES